MAMDAELWTEAIDLREAYQAGINDAKGEATMTEQLRKKAAALAC